MEGLAVAEGLADSLGSGPTVVKVTPPSLLDIRSLPTWAITRSGVVAMARGARLPPRHFSGLRRVGRPP